MHAFDDVLQALAPGQDSILAHSRLLFLLLVRRRQQATGILAFHGEIPVPPALALAERALEGGELGLVSLVLLLFGQHLDVEVVHERYAHYDLVAYAAVADHCC